MKQRTLWDRSSTTEHFVASIHWKKSRTKKPTKNGTTHQWLHRGTHARGSWLVRRELNAENMPPLSFIVLAGWYRPVVQHHLLLRRWFGATRRGLMQQLQVANHCRVEIRAGIIFERCGIDGFCLFIHDHDDDFGEWFAMRFAAFSWIIRSAMSFIFI